MASGDLFLILESKFLASFWNKSTVPRWRGCPLADGGWSTRVGTSLWKLFQILESKFLASKRNKNEKSPLLFLGGADLQAMYKSGWLTREVQKRVKLFQIPKTMIPGINLEQK